MIKPINPPRSAAFAFGMTLVVLFAVLAISVLAAPAGARANDRVGITVSERNLSGGLVTDSAKPLFVPYATARVKRCVVSRFYDGRVLEFSGKMVSYGESEIGPVTMQMRFEVFRKLAEHKRFKKLKGVGLGTWLPASDPKAGVYIREISLQGIETAAKYKARVSYRWLHPTGKVDRKRTLTTKPCNQRIGLPKLSIVQAKHQPIPTSSNSNYAVTVSNTGRSEALNVPVSVSVDSNPASFGLISSIAPGQTVDIAIQSNVCRTSAAVVVDPSRTVRQRAIARPLVQFGC